LDPFGLFVFSGALNNWWYFGREDKVAELFQAQLETAETRSPVLDVGTVVSIGDGIARVYGCEACLSGELEFADGSLGLALNLESQTVGAVRFASSVGTQTCTAGSL
jgi:F-type H+/Na+-transporting ATPase subunit alpha